MKLELATAGPEEWDQCWNMGSMLYSATDSTNGNFWLRSGDNQGFKPTGCW